MGAVHPSFARSPPVLIGGISPLAPRGGKRRANQEEVGAGSTKADQEEVAREPDWLSGGGGPGSDHQGTDLRTLRELIYMATARLSQFFSPHPPLPNHS